jgi:PAS domain-containing protein
VSNATSSHTIIQALRNKTLTYQELLEQNDSLNRELKHLRHQNKAEDTSEAKVKSLINNQDASIWSIDANYNYVVLNDFFIKAYKEAFGIELKKGAPALEMLEPELAAFWRDKYDQALSGNKIDFEFVHELNGREFFYQVSLNPVISNNEVTGVSALSLSLIHI